MPHPSCRWVQLIRVERPSIFGVIKKLLDDRDVCRRNLSMGTSR
jgi:hypothetical protein